MTEQTAFALTASAVGFVSAVYFCIGNAFNSVTKIKMQSTPSWDFSEPVARALAAQRAQYVTGGLLLLASFGLQVLAAVTSSTNPAILPHSLHTWPFLVLAVLVPTALLSWFGCRALENSTMRKVLQQQQEKQAAEEEAEKHRVP